MAERPDIEWVVLTMGDRPAEVRAAVASLDPAPPERSVIVVSNGGGDVDVGALPGVRTIVSPTNLGVPGGRQLGAEHSPASIVGFLDDDAVAMPGASAAVSDAFGMDPRLGAVSLRILDEEGHTARRHVPRPRGTDPDRSGPVALFLGGASAIRAEALHDVGGFFTDLVYGHEELELCWRLVDAGWAVHYLAEVVVEHPRTEIGRHADGWRLTGRNRVWIARRTLPWPIAMIHVSAWLLLGLIRAPGRTAKSAYLDGWVGGWRGRIERAPIRWRTVWTLTRLGRPPVI